MVKLEKDKNGTVLKNVENVPEIISFLFCIKIHLVSLSALFFVSPF